MGDIVENLTLSVRWLNIIIGLLLLIFGVIGSLSTIYVFTRPRFRNTPSVRYLLASSIANVIQLIHTLLPRILSDGFRVKIVNSNNQYCQARTYISAVATLCSLSYPCWASFDQYASTSRNAATRQYWTSKRFVYRAILGTVLFWLIVYLPTAIVNQAYGELCAGSIIILTYIYSYGILPLTYSVLPIVLIICFNIGIVRNLRQTRTIAFLQTKNRLVKQVQRMLIPQLIILVLSGIPFSAQTVYSVITSTTSKDAVRVASENLIFNIVRLLFYLNYVCSFYIYIIMSSEVRREVKDLIWKRNAILPQEAVGITVHGLTRIA